MISLKPIVEIVLREPVPVLLIYYESGRGGSDETARYQVTFPADPDKWDEALMEDMLGEADIEDDIENLRDEYEEYINIIEVADGIYHSMISDILNCFIVTDMQYKKKSLSFFEKKFDNADSGVIPEITVKEPKPFEKIEVCGSCGGEIINQGYSTDVDYETWTVCKECGQVEPEVLTKYICPECGEINDTDECHCK